ncbi:MAG: asparaginase domain-containing protein [Bacillota bacterium]
MNYRICLISTGGTIGSTLRGGVISVSCKKDEIAQLYAGSNAIEVDVLSPYNILSENIAPQNAEELLQCIKSIDCDNFDGIIVTHGTDTLAYTANYLDTMLQNIGKPIVLVSSAFPIEDTRSNASANFTAAVDFICQKKNSGVFVSYKNDGAEALIHSGSRIMQARQIDGIVDSVWGSYYAKWLKSGDFEYNNCNILSRKAPKSIALYDKLTGKLNNDIMYIKAFAFMDFDMYVSSITNKHKAIVIELYHSGTLPTAGFLAFVNKIAHLNIHIILTSASTEEAIYESFSAIENHSNLIICVGKSIENTLIKTMLALGSNFTQSEIKEFLED